MKFSSSILLIILCFSLAAPLTVHLASAGQEEHLVTLDVCHTTDASFSVNADNPVLFETTCRPQIPELAGFHEPGSMVVTSGIFPLQAERPPQA